MTDTSGPPPPPQPPPEFQGSVEAMEGYSSNLHIPTPVDPLQAQTAFERRARMEDFVAHLLALMQVGGFFMLAFAALLGLVDLSNSAAATFLGTVMGYAVGKVDPIMTRYFISRSARAIEVNPSAGPSTPPKNGAAAPAPTTPAATP